MKLAPTRFFFFQSILLFIGVKKTGVGLIYLLYVVLQDPFTKINYLQARAILIELRVKELIFLIS
jgi:hypothetical protein